MNHAAQNSLPSSSSLLPAIVAGGLIAGTLDAASAIHNFGWGMFYGIASGLLGSRANPAAGGGGPAIWMLGVALHFLIAFGSAAAYCASTRWLGCLRERFLVGGVMCGIAVFLTMNLVVLPLSAVPFPVGPFTVQGLRLGLLYTTLLVGLPISLSLWFFARRRRLAATAAA
ncbi:MAG TPA: hypothetical protein VG936_05170 [Lacunisphaera sp.]|nr:hypothetical protein [Lacunisphaera sp.]